MANMSGFRVFYSVLYCTFVFCLAAAIELNTDEVFMIPFDYNYFNWSTPQSPGKLTRNYLIWPPVVHICFVLQTLINRMNARFV